MVVAPNRYRKIAICPGSQSFDTSPDLSPFHFGMPNKLRSITKHSARRIWFWKSVKWFVHADDSNFPWKKRIESMRACLFHLSWCSDLRSAKRNCVYQSTTCIPSHTVSLPGTFAWRWSLCPRVPSAAWKRCVLRQPVCSNLQLFLLEPWKKNIHTLMLLWETLSCEQENWVGQIRFSSCCLPFKWSLQYSSFLIIRIFIFRTLTPGTFGP